MEDVKCNNCENTYWCSVKCKFCDFNGCLKCIGHTCDRCRVNMCVQCYNDETISCNCFGVCSECDTNINNGENGWSCSKCKTWFCDDCTGEPACENCLDGNTFASRGYCLCLDCSKNSNVTIERCAKCATYGCSTCMEEKCDVCNIIVCNPCYYKYNKNIMCYCNDKCTSCGADVDADEDDDLDPDSNGWPCWSCKDVGEWYCENCIHKSTCKKCSKRYN